MGTLLGAEAGRGPAGLRQNSRSGEASPRAAARASSGAYPPMPSLTRWPAGCFLVPVLYPPRRNACDNARVSRVLRPAHAQVRQHLLLLLHPHWRDAAIMGAGTGGITGRQLSGAVAPDMLWEFFLSGGRQGQCRRHRGYCDPATIRGEAQGRLPIIGEFWSCRG